MILTVKTRVEAIGFNAEEFSGHSLGTDLATSLVTAGVSSWKIKEHIGHAFNIMLTRYSRGEELFVDFAIIECCCGKLREDEFII